MKKRTPSTPPPEAAAHPAPAFTPVPRKHPRRDGWTPERQQAFIDALAATGIVRAAARAVNMASEGAYMLRRQPGGEEFAAAWDAVLEHRITVLRDNVIERAIEGVEVPVVYHGVVVTTRRTYNERAATFLLRNYDGLMAGGAAGLPVRLRRVVDEEVARVRAEEKAEQRRAGEQRSDEFWAKIERVREELIKDELMPGIERMSSFDIWVQITAIVQEVFARLPSMQGAEEADVGSAEEVAE